MKHWEWRVGIKDRLESEDTEENECSEHNDDDGRRQAKSYVCECLPFGWTPSPAYPGRLGAAGSVLIPASSNAVRKVDYEL
jgi:hypothetical protein